MKHKAWARQRERGSTAMVRLMIFITLRLGNAVGRIILGPIALYFFLSSAAARAASREFLSRARTTPASGLAVLRHFFSFASVILDRVFFLSGRIDAFDIEIEGLDHLKRALAAGGGCVLLGAHFGSFEVLRILGRRANARVRPVMFRQNATAVTRVLEALDPGMQETIIEIGRPDTMLRVRESLARGEIVGMLADRAPNGTKLIAVPFLGGAASFPTGPFIAIASLGVPAVLFFGIRTGARRYTVRFEPFSDRIVLPRASRQQALRLLIERYAARLDAHCRAYPLNWFNFYRFWDVA